MEPKKKDVRCVIQIHGEHRISDHTYRFVLRISNIYKMLALIIQEFKNLAVTKIDK